MSLKGIALLLSVCAASVHARGAVPVQLAAALERHGCLEIVDYSDFQNLRGRWWISLKDFTDSDADFAFFCHDRNDRLKTRLIVDAAGVNHWRACRQTVEAWQGQLKPFLPLDLEVAVNIAREIPKSIEKKWQPVASTGDTYAVSGAARADVPYGALVFDTTSQESGRIYACVQGAWYAYQWTRRSR